MGKLFVCALLFLGSLSFLSGQQTGSVSGVVRDQSGQVVPKAAIELENKPAAFLRKTTSDSQGRYVFTGVPAGQYELRAHSPGFQLLLMQGITVATGAAVKADLVLKVGSVSQTLEVTSTASAVSTSRAYLGRKRARGIRKPTARFNTEEYGSYLENEFSDVRREPLSTFAIDVDTASYSNIRRFLSQREPPPPDSVRIEELINYFPYQYKEPAADSPFSITTAVANCPWKPQHQIVHIGLRTRSIDVAAMPPANLVFLIDVSGSMDEENKLPLVKRSLRLLVDQLRDQDRVAIVVYAGAAGTVLSPTSGRDKDRILKAIEVLEAGGSTHGAEGIRMAYQLARESFIQGGNNRVILATDGDFNVGVSSDGELVRLIEKEREAGVFLTVLGFGVGNLKDAKMEKLADHGNGNYAYVDSLGEARKVLVEQMSGTLLTVAKDVKLQVEFNPAHVKSYRLIGYETRILRPEEFNDDRKDAGEAGAGMAVTALYEIVPAKSKESSGDVDELRYQQKSTATKRGLTGELGMVKCRYKAPDENKSRLVAQSIRAEATNFLDAPQEMRFAAAVAEYGLLLRHSKFAEGASFAHVVSVADEARGEDRGGHRREFVELAKTAWDLSKTALGSK